MHTDPFEEEDGVDPGASHKEDCRLPEFDFLDQQSCGINFNFSQQSDMQSTLGLFSDQCRSSIAYSDSLAADLDNNLQKRFSFHNFQKYLVTTIRSIINSQNFRVNQATHCEKKIWNVFMNSSKLNKTLVQLIFADLSKEPLTKLKQYGFKDIVKQFSFDLIKLAQDNLYEDLMEQLTEANLEKELEARRMKNKKEFLIYFKVFLKELEKGKVDKRMAKSTKILGS